MSSVEAPELTVVRPGEGEARNLGTIGVVLAATMIAGNGRFWPALLTMPCGYLAAWGIATAVAAVDRNESAPVVIGAVAGAVGLVLGPLSSLLIPLHSPRRTVLDFFDIF